MKFIFNDSDFLESVSNEYNKLPKNVKGFISDRVLANLNDLLINLDKCESPIEQLLGIALFEYAPKRLEGITSDYFIFSQEPIKTSEFSYRADFVIDAIRNNDLKRFVIECDGHDYHEKTKKQAKRDKERDRNMTQLGYTVIRFTGSEIFENPIVCARETFNIIASELLRGS